MLQYMRVSTHSTQLSGSILSEDQGPDRVSGCDQHPVTVRQWQAGQSIVCPDQGRGNQSLPTELLILLMDSSGCVPTSHSSSRKALKNDTVGETCDRFGGDLLHDENVQWEGEGRGKGEAQTPYQCAAPHATNKNELSQSQS